jgi:hypothetical protein
MTQTPTNAAGELAARLLYLNQQKTAIDKEVLAIKEALEDLYGSDAIGRQNDADVLFSDGTYHKVRLQRKAMGKYFKVLADFKDDFSAEKHKLEARYIKAEKAEMADKACTWVVQEVKS